MTVRAFVAVSQLIWYKAYVATVSATFYYEYDLFTFYYIMIFVLRISSKHHFFIPIHYKLSTLRTQHIEHIMFYIIQTQVFPL